MTNEAETPMNAAIKVSDALNMTDELLMLIYMAAEGLEEDDERTALTRGIFIAQKQLADAMACCSTLLDQLRRKSIEPETLPPDSRVN